MSRFRILVESLVKSIYIEGLDEDAARLVALYEDAITDHYTGKEKTPAIGLTEYLDDRLTKEKIGDYNIKIAHVGHSGNGKSFYVSAYVEVPVVDGFDPMPVELIYRSADHSKRQNQSDEKRYKNIDVFVPDEDIFAKGANKNKYTKNPNAASDEPKYYIMKSRDSNTNKEIEDYRVSYVNVAINQIVKKLQERIKEYTEIFKSTKDKNKLPADIFYDKETHPLLVNWLYRYKELQKAKDKTAALDKATKDIKTTMAQQDKPKSDRPILSLNSFQHQ